jgi:hypothetical protein
MARLADQKGLNGLWYAARTAPVEHIGTYLDHDDKNIRLGALDRLMDHVNANGLDVVERFIERVQDMGRSDPSEYVRVRAQKLEYAYHVQSVSRDASIAEAAHDPSVELLDLWAVTKATMRML